MQVYCDVKEEGVGGKPHYVYDVNKRQFGVALFISPL